ncbi:hypothetical protein ABZX40_28280 [Streptomyces sp. NPDC004610]|uniref:hypothetical protein n=1 Tax=unclassified Streptomyces TaxID=2593676 RepID=UPI0033A48DFE
MTSTRQVCGVPGRMPVDLVALMLAHIEDSSDLRVSVRVDLRCSLEEHDTGPHHDLTWELDTPSVGEVWAEWTDETAERVVVRPDCYTSNGGVGGADEVCTLFAGHPGCHTFEYVDPQCPSHVYPDLWMSAEREDGARP